ncbi:MAG: hypothetical protein Q4A74_05525 [Cardiobacteriaceae bacterium]|nr:hypothetical protein [Cardiobacteriaceae bacterium]
MKKSILIVIVMFLTACQGLNLQPMNHNAVEQEYMPNDPLYAEMQRKLNANRDRMLAENPQSKISHKTVVAELYPGEQADIEIELDAGKHYTLFANCNDSCHDIDLALTRSERLDQTLAADTSADTTSPVLRYTPDRSGKYRASIIMASCVAAQCHYSLQIFESPEGVR